MTFFAISRKTIAAALLALAAVLFSSTAHCSQTYTYTPYGGYYFCDWIDVYATVPGLTFQISSLDLAGNRKSVSVQADTSISNDFWCARTYELGQFASHYSTLGDNYYKALTISLNAIPFGYRLDGWKTLSSKGGEPKTEADFTVQFTTNQVLVIDPKVKACGSYLTETNYPGYLVKFNDYHYSVLPKLTPIPTYVNFEYTDGSIAATQGYSMGGGTIKLPSGTNPPADFSFDGNWYSDEGCNELVGKAGDEYRPLEDGVTLYAGIYRSKYHLKYYPNFKSETSADPREAEVTVSDSPKDDLVTIVSAGTYGWREKGLTFKGWSLSADSSSDRIEAGQFAGDLLVAAADENGVVNLYAVWEKEPYTVSFRYEGGSEAITEKTVYYNDMYGTLPVTQRTGYDFDGWWTSTTDGVEVKSDSIVAIDGNHYLYARWSAKTYSVTTEAKNCIINADSTGSYGSAFEFSWIAPEDKIGYATSKPDVKIYLGTLAEGDPIASYSYGTSASYTMSGDYHDSIFIQVEYSQTPNKYMVSFDSAGGKYCVPIEVTYDAEYGILPETNKANSEFLGWFDENERQVTASDLVVTAKNHTLYARWKQKSYTIRFNANGGVGEMSDQVVDCGSHPNLNLNQFAKEGYKFQCWLNNDEPMEDGEEIGDDLAAPDETVELTAKWTGIKYTICYDANWKFGDGVLSTPVNDSVTCEYGKAKVLKAWDPDTKGLAYFLGWALTSDAKEIDFSDEGVVKNLTSEDGAIITLYAVWQSNAGALSEAVGCYNMKLTSTDSYYGYKWKVDSEGVVSGGFKPSAIDSDISTMTASVHGTGTVVFEWQKMFDDGATATFDLTVQNVVTTRKSATADKTVEYIYLDSDADYGLKWEATKGRGSGEALKVYTVRWYPGKTVDEVKALEGGPEPTEADAPTVSGDFSFKTDARFDYVILKTESLSEPNWTAIRTVTGDGNSIKLPMFEGTQGFFKVKVIQRSGK